MILDHFRFALLLSALLLLILFSSPLLPAGAQDADTYVYHDEAADFTVNVPADWTDESTDEVLRFVSSDGIVASVLAVQADDVEAAVPAALEAAGVTVSGPPVQTSEVPAPNGIWTQQIYFDDPALTLVLSQIVDDIAYVLIFETPDEAALVAAGAAPQTIILSFTIGEVVDLGNMEAITLDEAQLDDLTAYVEDAMPRFNIPGAAVAVVQDGEIVYENGFGVRAVGGDVPVDAETLFMIGSTTKSMTTLMMATLVDDGLLDWDAKVTDILPEFALSDPDATSMIRVRDLVNNTSGVPRHDLPLLVEALTPETLLDVLATTPLVAQPGEQFHYSNLMVALGGYVSAVAAGAEPGEIYGTYLDLMNERVFAPIGMDATTFDFEAALDNPNVAQPSGYNYVLDEYGPVPVDYERYALSVAPASGVWSNASDMARYLVTVMNGGITPEGERVVSEANLRETQTPAITTGGTAYYGMGWFVEDYAGQTMISHGGNTMGFTTDFAFLREANVGVLVMTNRGLSNAFNEAVREYLWELAFQREHDADVRAELTESLINDMMISGSAAMTFTLPAEESVADFLGEYEHGVSFRYEDGQFLINALLDDVPLLETGRAPGEFALEGTLASIGVEFAEDAEGGMIATFKTLIPLPGNDNEPYIVRRID